MEKRMEIDMEAGFCIGHYQELARNPNPNLGSCRSSCRP